jgi:hypothetical protein
VNGADVGAVVVVLVASLFGWMAGRAVQQARAARADLVALVRILEHRAAHPTLTWLRTLQSDLRTTFPEFFTEEEIKS